MNILHWIIAAEFIGILYYVIRVLLLIHKSRQSACVPDAQPMTPATIRMLRNLKEIPYHG